MKRAFDILASLCGLAIVSPLWVAIAIAIKLHDRGPVFFLQERVGRYGKLFRLWKFRTMVVHAEALGPQLTVGADARITPVGRWLRKCKLDELPQLINVLWGEMSIVGPRPEVPKYVAMYSAVQRQVLECTPGITDPASLKYFCESELLAGAADPQRLYIEQVMPTKLRINLEYAQRATLITDVAIILRTLAQLCQFKFGAAGTPSADRQAGREIVGRNQSRKFRRAA